MQKVVGLQNITVKTRTRPHWSFIVKFKTKQKQKVTGGVNTWSTLGAPATSQHKLLGLYTMVVHVLEAELHGIHVTV